MTPREQAPALSVQLQHTAHLLDRVMQGESTTALLAGLPSSLRPGIQALLLSVLRHAALARAASTHLVQKPPARPVMALLQTTLALMNVEPKPYPDHTLVNQAIEAAKNHRSTRHAAGLINACLRRWLREADSMRQVLMADPTVRWNLPGWWIERLPRSRTGWWHRWRRQVRASRRFGWSRRWRAVDGSRRIRLCQLAD